MTYFGGTSDKCLNAWNMSASEFNNPPNGIVDNGQAIVTDALVRAEQMVRGLLPERVLGLMTRVDGEIIVQDADSGQTTATLGVSASTTTSVVMWKFKSGSVLPSQLFKASTYRFTSFTVDSTDKKTVTFTTALEASDVIIASYDCNLGNNCASLQSVLYDFAALDILVPRLPELEAMYTAKVAADRQWLDQVLIGQSMIPEVAALVLVQETEQVRGAGVIIPRLPA